MPTAWVPGLPAAVATALEGIDADVQLPARLLAGRGSGRSSTSPLAAGAFGRKTPPVPLPKPFDHPPVPQRKPRLREPDPNFGGVTPEADPFLTAAAGLGLLASAFRASPQLVAEGLVGLLGPAALFALPLWMHAAFGNNSEPRFGQNPIGP